jgi:hypothetical protein
MILRSSDERFGNEVIGQAAILPRADSSRSTLDPASSLYLTFDMAPEYLIVHYVQSLMPPEWNDIDFVLSCAATKFTGPRRESPINIHYVYWGRR